MGAFNPATLPFYGVASRFYRRWCRANKLKALARLDGLNEFEQRHFSQGGEDGIISALALRIGTTNRFFVEFGVSDGSECNTAALALRYRWSGVMIEGDAGRFAELSEVYGERAGVQVVNRYVSAENIVEIFESANVPREFDLLSIDIDGNDYWVWEKLASYRPRIVITEYNGSLPPPKRWVMQYNPSHRFDGTTYYGASLASLNALAERLGYALVGTNRGGINAFWLRNDVLEGSGFRKLSPEEAYHVPRRFLFMRLPRKDGPSVEL